MLHKNDPPLPLMEVDPPSPQTPDRQFPQSPFTTTASLHSPPVTSQAKHRPSKSKRSFKLKRAFKHRRSLLAAIHHLKTPLWPLVSSTTGLQHPDFPDTLLTYHLLTSHQLDNLARYYHQVSPPVSATFAYPVTISAWVGTDNEKSIDLDTKRRRFGRFIGLKGCESPTVRRHQESFRAEEETEKALQALMELEWQRSLEQVQKEDSEAALRRKAGGY